MSGADPVRLFTLSTCVHCRAAKRFFQTEGIEHRFTDLDHLEGAERQAALEELRHYNPKCSVPTILIGGEVFVGFREPEIRKALGRP